MEIWGIAGLIFISLGVLGVSLLILRKLTKVHLLSYDIRDRLHDLDLEMQRVHRIHMVDLFQQLQLLPQLYAELDLPQGLPPMRGYAASPDFLLITAKWVKQNHPLTIVECGSGVSTIVFARCLQMNEGGHIISLEHDPTEAQKTIDYLNRYNLTDFATVIYAPLIRHVLKEGSFLWYDLTKLNVQDMDMIVVDGPPEATGKLARYPAGPLLLPLLRDGGSVFLDDAARPDEQEAVKRWCSMEPRLVVQTPRCEKGCTFIQLADPRAHGLRTE